MRTSDLSHQRTARDAVVLWTTIAAVVLAIVALRRRRTARR